MKKIIEKETIEGVKKSLKKSDKVFLFNLIVDYVFNGKDVRKKLETFVESRYGHIKNIVLNWLITSFDENDFNYDSWEMWIREYIGKEFADRFKRQVNKAKMLSHTLPDKYKKETEGAYTESKECCVKHGIFKKILRY
ncbi:hypothetical protein [Archaeoglobus sp.]